MATKKNELYFKIIFIGGVRTGIMVKWAAKGKGVEVVVGMGEIIEENIWV